MNPYNIMTRRLDVFQKLINATYTQLFSLWLIINAAFAAMYLALSTYAPNHAPTIPPFLPLIYRALDSLYFSVVTATTIGYGDIVPQGFSKVLTMMQSTMALLVFTVLVGKLVSQRQDETLHQVHRMTFEGVFYHIRHVLFIVRKDFDALIAKIGVNETLNKGDWENLSTAYLQTRTLIEEIPDLYNGQGFDLHNVDLNHEKLLFEAVHRTFMRIHTLLMDMEKNGIDWMQHESSARELRSLINSLDGTMPTWRERSPFHEEAEFQEMQTLSAEVHRQLKEKIKTIHRT